MTTEADRPAARARQEANMAAKVVKGTYQHYKGGFYEVLGLATDPDREGEWVVYQALGLVEDLKGEEERHVVRSGNKGALAICSVERFTEEVAGGDWWGGQKVPRFRLICRTPPDS
jgi:hypothetical protein